MWDSVYTSTKPFYLLLPGMVKIQIVTVLLALDLKMLRFLTSIFTFLTYLVVAMAYSNWTRPGLNRFQDWSARPQISNGGRCSINNINKQMTICRQMLKTWYINHFFRMCNSWTFSIVKCKDNKSFNMQDWRNRWHICVQYCFLSKQQ